MWQDYDDAHLRPAPADRYFDPGSLRRGTHVEMEHTQDRYTAKQIAKHHLVEDPDYYTKLHRLHLDGAEFGDARADLVSVLALVMGHDKAEAWMKSLETTIQTKAKEGALSAIPTIQAKIKPMIIGSMVVGGLGLLVGVVALVKSRRR
jgi:hypothetical protein